MSGDGGMKAQDKDGRGPAEHRIRVGPVTVVPRQRKDYQEESVRHAVMAAAPSVGIGPGPSEESDMPARVAVKLTMRSVDAQSTEAHVGRRWS